MKIKYPTGVTPIQKQPAMKSYTVKPVQQPYNYRYPWQNRGHRHSKYNANKISMFNIQFDSKAEARFCCLLKSKHIPFSYHHKYLLHPHVEYQYHGHTVKLIKRTYTPDFILWRHGQKHSWIHPWVVIDVKGKQQVTVGANRQMDDFSRKFNIPVTIARFNYKASKQSGLIVFDEQIKGTKVKHQVQSLPLI